MKATCTHPYITTARQQTPCSVSCSRVFQNWTHAPSLKRHCSVSPCLLLIPMCYVRGEDMAILSNAVSRREHESNFEIPSNRIQNREFAAEPWLYKDECKWLSKDEMSLNGLKRIEYWIPWSP